MAVLNDPLYGLEASSLRVQSRRLDVLSSNIANADTPGFKAKDIDFRDVLNGAQTPLQTAMPKRTHAGHVAQAPGGRQIGESWRVPVQPSQDGNTVDTQIEQAQYAEAAMRYEATLRFIDGRIKALNLAIKGQ